VADKRDLRRHKKRLSIHFGIGEEASRVAFTEDISIGGMFIKTPNVAPPNSMIRIEFSIGNERVILDARVMWAKKVPQNMFHLVKKSGMGVRFLRFHRGEEQYHEFCREMAGGI